MPSHLSPLKPVGPDVVDWDIIFLFHFPISNPQRTKTDMSKKSKRQAMFKEQVAQQRAETRKPPIKAKKVSKVAAPRRTGAYPAAAAQATSGKFSRASQVARSLNPSNLMRIRISAVALAVIALAVGIAWGLTTRGAYTSWTVVGMVLLGLVAGFCLLVAFRTEDMVKRARLAARR